jgi:glyoxylase-like metal-dependent hydrolase (beta-lactamase superfamily II)
MSAAELRPGLYRLEEPDGGRRLCQVVVVGNERTLIVDAGLPESPERGLLPLLASLRLDERPVVLLLTHPDADHRGGAPVLRDALARLEVWGHELDRDQLSNPDIALRERYMAFADSDDLRPPPERLATLQSRLGAPVDLDRTLSDRAGLDLGGRTVDILHMPGHSPGSVIAYLPEEGAALIADAAMGRGIPLRDGGLMYPPMYAPPSLYLETIDRLEALRPNLILTGHEPPLEGAAATRFLAKSREAATRLSALVAEALSDGRRRTLVEVCSTVADGYGDLPPDGASSLAMTVDGTLRELIDRGEAEGESGPPRRFRATS